ncbi:hypothetical protein DBV05_g12259 [Lasiodiplodia theobromae]|uniref:Sterol uptake control protein 2 n=1 Tax=Lasiodiplodia theobromae TaxID=45133 RepID=A0A5N5CUN9_9PEZI|nr:hypothetical protein DBV05_g12259 [Lasiodiplodia theobromae]
MARSTHCVYPATAKDRSTTNSTTPSTSTSQSNNLPHLPHAPSPSLPTGSSSNSRRLLELELMHRWTTRTYISLCSIPPDTQIFQLGLPQKALQYDWLLNSIFALSALDLSCTTPRTTPKAATYARAAIEYYDASVRSYRSAVADMTVENHDSLFSVGYVVAVYAAASMRVPREDGSLPSVLAQAPQFFDLLAGTSMISRRCMEWLMQSMESVRIIKLMEPATEADLDGGARAALARLGVVSEGMYPPVMPLGSAGAAGVGLAGGEGEDVVVVGEAGRVLEPNPEREMYARLIHQIMRCFAEDARGIVDGICLAFPAIAGPEFKFAIERSEPMALLVLVYWAICLEYHGMKMWWANGLGTRLIVEITEVLERSEAYLMPEFWEAVDWARRRVGLPGLLHISCSQVDVVELDDVADYAHL